MAFVLLLSLLYLSMQQPLASLLSPHIRSIQGFAGGVGLCTFAGLHRRAHGAPFPPKKTAGQLQGASFFGLSDSSAPPVNGLRVGNEVESEGHALFFIAAMHSKCTSDPRAARRTVPLLRGMRRGGGGAKRGDVAESLLPPPPPSVKTMFQAVSEPRTTCRILGGVMAEDVS